MKHDDTATVIAHAIEAGRSRLALRDRLLAQGYTEDQIRASRIGGMVYGEKVCK